MTEIDLNTGRLRASVSSGPVGTACVAATQTRMELTCTNPECNAHLPGEKRYPTTVRFMVFDHRQAVVAFDGWFDYRESVQEVLHDLAEAHEKMLLPKAFPELNDNLDVLDQFPEGVKFIDHPQ